MMTHFCNVRGVCGPNSLWESNCTFVCEGAPSSSPFLRPYRTRSFIHYTACVPTNTLDVRNLPNFTFTFESGARLQLTPAQYLSRAPLGTGWCLHLAIGVLSRDIGIILGDSFMRAFVTIFDRENSRVGFAPVGDSCPPTGQHYRMRNASVVRGLYREGGWIEAAVEVVDEATNAAPQPAGVRTYWSSSAGHSELLMSSMVPSGDNGRAVQRVFVESAPEKPAITLTALLQSTGERVVFVYTFDPSLPPSSQPDLPLYAVIPAFCIVFAAFVTTCACVQYRRDHRRATARIEGSPVSSDL